MQDEIKYFGWHSNVDILIIQSQKHPKVKHDISLQI